MDNSAFRAFCLYMYIKESFRRHIEGNNLDRGGEAESAPEPHTIVVTQVFGISSGCNNVDRRGAAESAPEPDTIAMLRAYACGCLGARHLDLEDHALPVVLSLLKLPQNTLYDSACISCLT